MKKLLLILVVCIFIFGPRLYKSYLDNEIENTMEGWVMDYNPINKQMELHPPEYFDSINRVHVNSFPKYEKTYYNNGNLKEEGNLLNSFTEDGLWKHYNKDGTLYYETNWKNGKKEGPTKEYYKDGQLKGEGNYKNDDLNGLYKWYHENGKLRLEQNWRDDKIVSKKCWDEDGNEIECKE